MSVDVHGATARQTGMAWKVVIVVWHIRGVLAGGAVVSLEVGACVAPEAVLPLHGGDGRTLHGITREHAEALQRVSWSARVLLSFYKSLQTYRLEGCDLSGLCRDVVDENSTLRLGAESVVELVSR